MLRGKEPLHGAQVLHDVSFDIMPGESYGIIGENGAGKSTLLKVLTGVISPSRGSVIVRPRVAALLELGAGFQPDFSGLDNVRMKSALLGMTPAQLDQRMDQILEFADIGEYVHEPVKHYSSGMVVRLGFAVVAASDPELLITDEVLAVGDESFQKKCIQWIESFLEKGNSLLLVSHSMFIVQKLCQRALWLHEGRAHMQGDVFDVTQSYLAWHESRGERERQQRDSVSGESGIYRIESFELVGMTADGEVNLYQGDSLEASLTLISPDGRAPVALFGIVRADGTAIYGVSSDFDDIGAEQLDTGRYRYRLCFRELPLLPGSYSMRAHAMDPEGLRVCDTGEKRFRVKGQSRELGFVRLQHTWVEPESQTGSPDGMALHE
ncbi:MAG TPA: ABC transporter ATP-binding protein [Xanthomonadales bacterium]|nr:ABC transporter ATP-binding protein [Xanthomonadales bacterium]